MKPLFTIHEGEYLVGNYIEQNFKDWEVWIPSKDDGADFLITNRNNRKKNVSLQVKYSKDYVPFQSVESQKHLRAWGWWSFSFDVLKKNINKKAADFWVLAMQSFEEKKLDCIIINPTELDKLLSAIHGRKKSLQTYFWVSKNDKCYETRGLKKEQQNALLTGNTQSIKLDRIFTNYLNNWKPIIRSLT